MRPRQAFTLLELIVSITVAGIIALLAYGSARAGFDTRDAIARHRDDRECDADREPHAGCDGCGIGHREDIPRFIGFIGELVSL